MTGIGEISILDEEETTRRDNKAQPAARDTQMPTAREVLQQARAKRSQESSEAALQAAVDAAVAHRGPAMLGRVWKTAYLLAFPGHWVKTPNIRELNQLRRICAEVGWEAGPVLIAETVRRWPEFVQVVAKAGGHKGVGDMPHVGVLEYHRHVAIDWLAGEGDASACADEEDGPSWDF